MICRYLLIAIGFALTLILNGHAQHSLYSGYDWKAEYIGASETDKKAKLIHLNDLQQTAHFSVYQGNLERAVEYAEYANSWAERHFLPSSRSLIRTRTTLGGIYLGLGRLSEADAQLTHASNAAKDHLNVNDPIRLRAIGFLASLYGAQGRLNEAKLLLESTPIEASKDKYNLASEDLMLTLANIYVSLGLYSDAESILKRYLEVMREKLYRNEDEDDILIASGLQALGRLYLIQSRFQEAETYIVAAYNIAQREYGEHHIVWQNHAFGLANLFAATGRTSEAEAMYLRLITLSEGHFGKDHLSRAHYLSALSQLLRPRNNRDGVEILFMKEAVNIFQRARFEITLLDRNTQTAFLEEHASHYETLQQWLIEAGRFAEAEQVGRMLKEQEYFEFIRRTTRGEDPREALADLTPLESAWADQFAAWSERPNKIAVTLAALLTKQRSGTALTALEETQLYELNKQYDIAYTEYQQNVNTWLASVRTLSDETIQAEARALEASFHDDLQGEIAEIGDDVAALQVVAFEGSLHLFLITPYAFKHIETQVQRADLNEAIFAARRAVMLDPITGLPDPNAKNKLQTLHQLLIAPIEQDLADAGTETLMLNLQGAIRYVPFAALYDGDQYLTERFNFALFTPAARTRFERATDMGEGSGFGVTAPHTIDGLGTFSKLPGVKEELATILGSEGASGIISGSIDLDEDFTRESFERRLEEGRPVVHIASHFYMRAGNDANSFLLLGDGTALTLAEINESSGLRFRGVELLVLSACSTALNSQGDFDVNSGTGAEVEGFGVLAQRKGAEAVLASLWDVADDATSTLMSNLYANLSGGKMTKAEALQAAQMEMIADPQLSHPYYWAPFILMGNWK